MTFTGKEPETPSNFKCPLCGKEDEEMLMDCLSRATNNGTTVFEGWCIRCMGDYKIEVTISWDAYKEGE